MALLERDGNPNKVLEASDFNSQGETKNVADDLALVVGCAVIDESFIQSKQWNLNRINNLRGYRSVMSE
jgi:hypothetical protein